MARTWKLWAPLLVVGLVAAVWLLLGVLAPVEGCYTEEESGPPESLTLGVIAVGALAAGFLGWSNHRSFWPTVAYALGAAVAVIPLLLFETLTWAVANGCPISGG